MLMNKDEPVREIYLVFKGLLKSYTQEAKETL